MHGSFFALYTFLLIYLYKIMKLSIIGGGNMGAAIAYGAVNGGVSKVTDVAISHLSEKMRPLLSPYINQLTITRDNQSVVSGADVIVVSVKPWQLEAVLAEIAPVIDRERQIIVSVVAAVSHSQLKEYMRCSSLGEVATYRVIPNTAISISEGVTHICGHHTTCEQDGMLQQLFGAMGMIFMVEEQFMEPLTALSSCGIAYAFKYIDAIIEGAVALGVDRVVARDAALGTVLGAVKMLQGEGTMPQTEIDKVTTEGGLTFKGLAAMEREGFTRAVVAGLKESR